MPGEICPLLLAAREPSKTLMEQVLCRKDKCAWWCRSVIPQKERPKIIEMCSILKIAKSLKYPQQ